MKEFRCHCGHRVFFDNTECQNCGMQLGFDPEQIDIISLYASSDGRLTTPAGVIYRRCSNFHRYYNCNWLLKGEDPADLCFSCRMNEVIPALDRDGNLKLWTRLEEAKRRLLYSLLKFDLPLTGNMAPRFRFLEDRSRNPDVYETFVATGRLDRTITINVAEADDAARHAQREQMHELYRTVLGHLRHESGHLYFDYLTANPATLDRCRDLFGNEKQDYSSALKLYYDNGPAFDWHENFVSAYATSHPAEDFAETFAHFLHITDALESARVGNMAPEAVNDPEDDWISAWIGLAITLNEISRSLGTDDPYPFLLPDPVRAKLEFMNQLVRRQV